MNPQRFIVLFLCVALCSHAFAQTADIDTGLSDLADKLAAQVQGSGKKKVTVIDFTDLNGSSNGELGKYIAEQLNVDLVMGKRDFSVLDRANLKSILAEHKLTATGLIDPDNAKKLGQFAGVDALILGTITPKGQSIKLTAKIITTDTAEIVGAARTEFKLDDTVQNLMTKPSTETNAADIGAGDSDIQTSTPAPPPAIVKKLGDLKVELQSLTIVDNSQYLLTMALSNASKRRNIYVALRGGFTGNAHGSVFDPNGFEFMDSDRDVSGIPSTLLQYPSNGFTEATEVDPGDSITVTVKFHSLQSRTATSGKCNVRLEFLLGYDFNNGFGSCTSHTLGANMDAE